MIETKHVQTAQSTMREEIYAFADESDLPFRIVMAGITHPDPSYRIERSKKRNRIFVFEYVIFGQGEIEIEGNRYKVAEGDTYILTPDTDQCYYSDKNEPFKKIWVNIESSYLSALLEAHGLRYGVYRYNSYSKLEEILRIAKSCRSLALASAEAAPLLLSLIEALSQKYEKKEDRNIAHMAREHMDALNGTAFSPTELAGALHVSLSTLTRDFRRTYGCTPYEYYLSQKEKIAKSLLQNTALSAKEIAFRLGFSDEHYFSNFFKKRTGLRPMEYKKGCSFDP